MLEPLPPRTVPALSFRTKLILAMSLIVVGVTSATIIVTEQRVQATYQRLFEEQFNLQIRFFSETRLRLLEQVAKRCETIAKSVRIVSALEEAIASDDPDFLYDNLDTELDGLSKGASTSDSAARRPATSNGGEAAIPELARETSPSFLRPSVTVVDAQGRILEPKNPRSYFFKPPAEAGRAQSLHMFEEQSLGKVLKQQEIGYLASRDAGGAEQLREFIVTPLVNVGKDEPETLGAIIIGFPVSDIGENFMYQFSDKTLLSGICLENKIYTKTIPATVRDEVAGKIAQDIKAAPTDASTEVVDLNGVPHRLFYKVLNPDSIFPTASQVCLYSMAEVVRERAELRQKILSFGSVALLGGIGLVMLISHGFSKPIEMLVQATRRIQRGDYSVKVPVRTRDEMGALAASFNDMAADLALKDRYKSVLAQVADQEVAEQLISGKLTLGGEVRKVSVIFCDIRGFTALTETMPPGEVITMLNEHMTAMNRIVHEHHGVVDKFVGDLIMAVFGAPKSYGDDAVNAARCALAMLEVRHQLNKSSQHHIEMGIGLATGEVVAGCMGSLDRLNYTVLGERVNLASRLCSKAGRMEALIDETTCQHLPDPSHVERMEPLELKGFSEPVPAFRLLRLGDSPVDSVSQTQDTPPHTVLS